MTETKTKRHYWLYVLKLHEDKYYVGITSRKDPNDRIQEHMNGFYSAQWVKKYKPIEPLEIIDIGDLTKSEAGQMELHRTLQYMKKYGLQSVRGGMLNYSGKYVKIGSRFWRGEDFGGIIMVLTMMLVMLLLLLVR